jgi:hypothetical protein
MSNTIHEGLLLREYIEAERGRLSEVSDMLNLPRTSIYRLYGESVLPDSIKLKLSSKGIKIDFEKVSHSVEKKQQGAGQSLLTNFDMMDLMRETITALKGENDAQKRYIKLLEERLKN